MCSWFASRLATYQTWWLDGLEVLTIAQSLTIASCEQCWKHSRSMDVWLETVDTPVGDTCWHRWTIQLLQLREHTIQPRYLHVTALREPSECWSADFLHWNMVCVWSCQTRCQSLLPPSYCTTSLLYLVKMNRTMTTNYCSSMLLTKDCSCWATQMARIHLLTLMCI